MLALGEYGIPDMYPPLDFKHLKREEVYHICYRNLGQTVSVCNYWTDPTKRKEYLANNYYLPFLNNEVPHASAKRYPHKFFLAFSFFVIPVENPFLYDPFVTNNEIYRYYTTKHGYC